MQQQTLLMHATLTQAPQGRNPTASSTCSTHDQVSHASGHCTPRTAVMAQRKRVLISNDDGINAPGLLALVQALVADGLFDVCVCGPADEQVSSCAEELPPSAVLVHLILQTARQWSVARGLHRCCGPSELSAVCCSPAPQALTLVAGLQSAKSHAITLGRPLVSYPIEVPQTAEAYAVRAPLYVLELRYAISADASARMRDLAAHKPAYVRHAGRGNARRLSHAGPQQLTVQGAAAGSLSCLARVRFLSGCI